VDFITKLPIVARKDVILVVCDQLSKMTHFVATTERTLAEGKWIEEERKPKIGRRGIK